MAALAQAEITPEQLAQFATLRAEARAYEFGDGVPKDPVRAQETYCKAARMGGRPSPVQARMDVHVRTWHPGAR
jgi:TPR repeat protein